MFCWYDYLILLTCKFDLMRNQAAFFLFFSLAFVGTQSSCTRKSEVNQFAVKTINQYSETDWKKLLNEESYQVCREGKTERPFSGQYCNFFDDGEYKCIACKEQLFISGTKMHTNCGWPSFSAAVNGNVGERPDTSNGMIRTEIFCKKCRSHLGHVFEDHTEASGKRYCVNSASLSFVAAKNNIQ